MAWIQGSRPLLPVCQTDAAYMHGGPGVCTYHIPAICNPQPRIGMDTGIEGKPSSRAHCLFVRRCIDHYATDSAPLAEALLRGIVPRESEGIGANIPPIKGRIADSQEPKMGDGRGKDCRASG